MEKWVVKKWDHGISSERQGCEISGIDGFQEMFAGVENKKNSFYMFVWEINSVQKLERYLLLTMRNGNLLILYPNLHSKDYDEVLM